MTKPILSICCLAYNQAKYIRQTLNGFINQVTEFEFEILIYDDASTDGTSEIILEYAKKYSNIRPFIQEKNQWEIGEYGFVNHLIPMSQGKYMALCEGDDYWTDCYKLQKQIDFLEAHNEYSISFHNVEYRYEHDGIPSILALSPNEPSTFTFKDLAIRGNFIPTCSIILRNRFDNRFIELLKTTKIGDWVTSLLVSQNAKIHYLNQVMGVYRIHSGGVWSKLKTDERLIILQDTINKLCQYFKDSPEHIAYLELGRKALTKKYKLQKAASTKTFKIFSFIKKILTYCTPYYLVIKFKSK